MSNPASFWAAKSNGLEPPTAPSPAVTEASKHCITAKNDNTVLKDTTNSAKEASWTESDDDEEFHSLLTKNLPTQKLEEILAAKDTLIADLTATLQEKDVRIAELEGTLTQQRHRLHDIQCNTNLFVAQIEELKSKSNKQFLQIQQLVAEVDEKDRRIVILETAVDEHYATIAELDAGDSSTQVSSNENPALVNEVKATHKAPHDGNDADENFVNSKQPAEPVTNAVNTKSFKATKTSVKSVTKSRVAVMEATGPTANLSGFPIFATPATLKRVAPPPPAPKLKMGVDLSKFVKKPVSIKNVAKTKSTSGAVKQDIRNGPVPKLDPMADIRTKRQEERVLFAKGPKVHVKMGDTTLATVPKYILMQCSNKAFKHFSEHPDDTIFTLPSHSMNADAATSHLEWMKEMTYQGRVYSITFHAGEKFDDKNLQICRAARVLGLNNMYVGHFTKIFCNRIRSNTASIELFSKIATIAYPENDPINDCLVNNLASLRMRTPARKQTELNAFVEKFPALKARIEMIEDRMRKKQDADRGGNDG